jgi:hypothetical protein
MRVGDLACHMDYVPQSDILPAKESATAALAASLQVCRCVFASRSDIELCPSSRSKSQASLCIMWLVPGSLLHEIRQDEWPNG